MSDAILIVEDEAILAKNIRIFFERAGYDARVAQSAEDALMELDDFRPDLVLLDFQLPGINGLEMLELLREREPQLPVVMLTGQGTVELAVRAMRSGAVDFLSKPVALQHLRVVVDRLLDERRNDTASQYYRARSATGVAALIGESQPMRQLKETIRTILEAEATMTDAAPPTILVTGETGTGKELVARALHCDGPRSDGPFIELNCATVPAPLLEAELFGYERGAFTDAKERKIGLVEAATGGTLFLDEIGDMDPALQAKVLKLLEEKVVRRLGAIRDQKVDVRIIAATHQPLDQLVAQGKFRADLYFRLRMVQIELPPLRERGDDILLLAKEFLAQQSLRYRKQGLSFSQDAQTALRNHAWIGNVRELRNLIEQTVLLASDPIVAAKQLAFYLPSKVVPTDLEQPEKGRRASDLVVGDEIRPLSEVERGLLVEALHKTSWNVTRAARLLGISRDTLRYRIEKHNLSRYS
ncbi:MAG TPA: sigma-54 dependent transcriptional regulator [Rhodocyclaceae bacterium]